MKIYNQDCLDKLKELDNNSIDSIITDPPYGLSFMGKKWDYDVPSVDIWIECLRVLKSGGHLLAFAGSRTYHRMAVRIEDAGFEIRDQIMWIYGSGFPKSHNIGKAVDKLQGNERIPYERPDFVARSNKTKQRDSQVPSGEKGKYTKGNSRWEGWGTALKPAHEPIVMARKPFKGTVAQNVLEWGTGGINIDASRISTDEDLSRQVYQTQSWINSSKNGVGSVNDDWKMGRFPANIIFDEEAGKILDEQSGNKTGQRGVVKGTEPSHSKKNKIYGDYSMVEGKYAKPIDDLGGASRFFYCPKAQKKDRNEGLEDLEDKQSQIKHGTFGRETSVKKRLETSGENSATNKNVHPTVKPTDLMTYLVRLVTPKGGTVLDPFMGSGSTGKAAIRGGFDFIGIEREKEYYDIAKARIKYEQEKQKPDPQQKLF